VTHARSHSLEETEPGFVPRQAGSRVCALYHLTLLLLMALPPTNCHPRKQEEAWGITGKPLGHLPLFNRGVTSPGGVGSVEGQSSAFVLPALATQRPVWHPLALPVRAPTKLIMSPRRRLGLHERRGQPSQETPHLPLPALPALRE